MLTVYFLLEVILTFLLQHLSALSKVVASNVNLLRGITNVWLYSSTQAETRAEFAERSVAKLEKTIDDLEGMNFLHLIIMHLQSLFSDFSQNVRAVFVTATTQTVSAKKLCCRGLFL